MAGFTRSVLTLLTAAAAVVATATPAAAYPLPGRVTGAIGVHDPSAVKRPDGSYLIAHTATTSP